MRTVILLALAISASVAAASSLTYGDAKAIADRDVGSLSRVQSELLGDAEETVMDQCRSNRLQPFVVVMKLDLSGKVLQAWHAYDSDIAVCFERNLTHIEFRPPRAPFYISIKGTFSQ